MSSRTSRRRVLPRLSCMHLLPRVDTGVLVEQFFLPLESATTAEG